MSSIFGKKKTVEEECKQAKRDINGSTREMDRELRKLDRQEQEMLAEVKKAVQRNDEATARTLAKSINQLREQRKRMMGNKAHMTGMAHRTTQISAQHKQMETMGKSAAIMGKMNAQVDPAAMQKIMQEFQMQNAKLDMTSDLMDEGFDCLDDDDMDDETAAVMDQVLDEVCFEMKSGPTATSALPTASASRAGSSRVADRNMA
eukprot:TRINITY_DN1091_c0_g2_i1.p1 TRINITY_DN1091_c0_g2~~TRINITY_DN1091_c0_g2_i1.p1  ORF type:complete len:227 (+),score=119.02 TRINITY_DN1091_c0_g2_i1:72-683(+)